jgi:nicotinate-nucleotide adenylyltransferase
MAAMGEDVLLFGGTFDPIHVGHLIVARHVRERLGVRQTVLVPAAAPPHKMDRALAAAEHRLAMVRLAVVGQDDFAVDDQELRRHGPSYTIDTVADYRRRLGGRAQIHWLIGSDTAVELGSWHRIGELADLCTFVTAARPGFEACRLDALAGALAAEQIEWMRRHVVAAPLIEVSSTQIRRRVAEGRSIRFLVPDAVAEYIADRGLYRRSLDSP